MKLNLKGNNGDADKVSAFINAIEKMTEAGKISDADALPILAAAEALLKTLA